MGSGQPDITRGRGADHRGARRPGAPLAGPAAGGRGRSHGPARQPRASRAGVLRGLYSGGTLADEAMVVAGIALGDIRSNIPLRPDLALPPAQPAHRASRI